MGLGEKGAVQYDTLKGLRWRVDVAISTSHLEKSLVPSVLLAFTFGDGRIERVEMNVAQFQSFRYNIVRLLKDMDECEKNPILRL